MDPDQWHRSLPGRNHPFELDGDVGEFSEQLAEREVAFDLDFGDDTHAYSLVWDSNNSRQAIATLGDVCSRSALSLTVTPPESEYQRAGGTPIEVVFVIGWYTKSVVYAASARSLRIERYNEIRSEEELERALCRLFHTAYKNGVPIGPTWACQYEDWPDLEVMVFELAAR